MSANGQRPTALCACGQAFLPRSTRERYCSNACAGKYGTATMPHAAPVERPKPREPAPAPPPRAIERMHEWVEETKNVRWPS